MKLVLATRNQGKVRELTEMLRTAVGRSRDRAFAPNAESRDPIADSQIEVLSLKSYPDVPEVVEDGATYAENAIKKASVIAEWTGHLTLADDAGLEVDALNGAPGVHSKRWLGEAATDAQRVTGLLKVLEGVADRRARFVAAIAVVHPGTDPKVVTGVCEGHITQTPTGTHGFGYDPIFVPEGYKLTFAELGEQIKNKISHRAKALQQARALL